MASAIAIAPVRPQVAAVPMTAGAAAELQADREAKLAAADERVVAMQFKRAEAGCPQAQYDLALRHLSGRGVALDECAAMGWLDLSANAGHQQAQKLANTLAKK